MIEEVVQIGVLTGCVALSTYGGLLVGYRRGPVPPYHGRGRRITGWVLLSLAVVVYLVWGLSFSTPATTLFSFGGGVLGLIGAGLGWFYRQTQNKVGYHYH